MGNKSEKKIEAKRKEAIGKILIVIAVCTVIGFFGRLFRYDIFEKWEIGQFLFLGLVNYFVYKGIDQRLALGVSYEGNMDLLIINNAVLVLTVISKWCWVLYLSVPLYFVYQLLKMCWGQLSSTSEEPPAAAEEEDGKKKKKEKREKVKYIKG